MINNGILFHESDPLNHWNTHNIDNSNTVNGKPVYYWKDQVGGTIPADAGQVILANCTNVIIEGQELTNSTVGIQLGFSSYNDIIGNNASSNNLKGIHLYNSSNNNILYNYISSNSTSFAIQLRGSNENNITGNFLPLNLVGMHFSYSNYNLITDNTVSLNDGCGIYLKYSRFNTIYHNNLIDNVNQAIDETNNGNQWDNGYPEGGNYWTDFDELSEGAFDDFNGSDQNMPGSDGIVDLGPPSGGKNPYVIDPDSQDNYPLINFSQRLFLYPSWNLISVPLIQSDSNLSAVLSPIAGSYDSVWAYDISDYADHWKHNHTSKPAWMNDLNNIDHTMGFWIFITEPGGVIFEYPGTPPSENQTITLYPGWNLVGYPSKSDRLRDDALGDLAFGDDIYKIIWYNPILDRMEEVTKTDYLKIGFGYWIYANKFCVWDVPL